jgi:hypothetical protein
MRSLASRSVGQAFEDGAVQVGAGVHVAKADDGALGLGAGHLDAGVPEGLQHQALRARRHGVHQLVEQALGRHARSRASCCSCWPNCSLNQLTIQKPA